jgi:DNA-binding beta-propeller fold protein YncE
LCFSGLSNTAYVANWDSDSVSAGKVTDAISVPDDPDNLALSPDGSQLWVGQTSLAPVPVPRFRP